MSYHEELSAHLEPLAAPLPKPGDGETKRTQQYAELLDAMVFASIKRDELVQQADAPPAGTNWPFLLLLIAVIAFWLALAAEVLL
jgi:hypothetical protein